VLTKGGDYNRADVVGHDLVADTRVLTLVPGRSTSSLIDAIRGRNRRRTDRIEASVETERRADCLPDHAPQTVACAQA
jgi:hypothetical protein